MLLPQLVQKQCKETMTGMVLLPITKQNLEKAVLLYQDENLLEKISRKRIQHYRKQIQKELFEPISFIKFKKFLKI